MDNEYDVLVIGGGPGGTPAAMALAQAGKKVLLVEAGAGLGGPPFSRGASLPRFFVRRPNESATLPWRQSSVSIFHMSRYNSIGHRCRRASGPYCIGAVRARSTRRASSAISACSLATPSCAARARHSSNRSKARMSRSHSGSAYWPPAPYRMRCLYRVPIYPRSTAAISSSISIAYPSGWWSSVAAPSVLNWRRYFTPWALRSR